LDILLSAVAFVLLMVAGSGVALLAMPRRRTVTTTELLSLSVFFGAAFVSLVSFVLGFLLTGSLLRFAVSIASLSLGVLGILSRRRREIGIAMRLPGDVPSILALGILIGLVGFHLVRLTFHHTLGWDGLFVWEFKARIASLSGGAIPLSYYTDLSTTWSHPEYPLLLPLSEAWLYSWLGPNQQMAKLVFLLFSLATVGLLFTAGSRLSGCRWQGFLAATLFFFVPVTILGDYGISSGYADGPLGGYYLACVIYLVEHLEKPEGKTVLLAAILAAVLPWIKQEGAILWLSLLFAAILASGRTGRHPLKTLIPLAVPGLLVIVGWQVLMGVFGTKGVGMDFIEITSTNLGKNLPRLIDIGLRMRNELIDWNAWGFLWPAFILALVLPGSGRFGRHRLALAGAVIIPNLFYMCVFVFSAWQSFLGHVDVSLPRLMMQTSFTAVLAIALAVPTPRGTWPSSDTSTTGANPLA